MCRDPTLRGQTTQAPIRVKAALGWGDHGHHLPCEDSARLDQGQPTLQHGKRQRHRGAGATHTRWEQTAPTTARNWLPYFTMGQEVWEDSPGQGPLCQQPPLVTPRKSTQPHAPCPHGAGAAFQQDNEQRDNEHGAGYKYLHRAAYCNSELGHAPSAHTCNGAQSCAHGSSKAPGLWLGTAGLRGVCRQRGAHGQV